MIKIRNRYRLSKSALDAVRDIRVRHKIALLLDVSDQTMFKYIKSNSIKLTIPDVVELIHEETGLAHNEILERASDEALINN